NAPATASFTLTNAAVIFSRYTSDSFHIIAIAAVPIVNWAINCAITHSTPATTIATPPKDAPIVANPAPTATTAVINPPTAIMINPITAITDEITGTNAIKTAVVRLVFSSRFSNLAANPSRYESTGSRASI